MNPKQSRRKTTVDLGTMIYGKIPPQAKDIEEAILGALMLHRSAIDIVAEILRPEAFYVESHQLIFKAMLSLTSKGQPIDILTVSEELRLKEELDIVGGSYYVTKLTNTVVSSANIETHSRIVLQKYIQRKVIELGGKLVQEAYEDNIDVFDLIDNTEVEMYNVTKLLHRNNYFGIDKLLVKATQEIHAAAKQQDKLSGVTSGFRDVDRRTHGWQKTDLIILAARPAVGKTALALNLARNAAMAGTATAFFSLEMSSGQLIRRLMSAESEIPLDKIQRARLDEEGLARLFTHGVKVLSGAKLFIDDTAGLNSFELRAKARRLKQKEDIGLIIIDYLQLMSGTNTNGRQNREQEISEISRNLKRLAKELDIPIIALSQLSRETEKRASKDPQLSDLRESGAIEQDADAVIFIYRAEYYGIHHDEVGEVSAGETILKFAKYRNGSTGKEKLRAQLWIQKFVDMEESPLKENMKKSLKNKEGVTQSWQPFKEQVDKEDTTFQ